MNTVAESRRKDKIELAQELGMHSYVVARRMEEERKRLTELKLKPTTRAELERKLCRRPYYRFDSSGIPLCAVAILITAAAVLLLHGWWQLLDVIPVAMSALFLALTFFECPELGQHPLEHWQDDVPYGAMLAVKEAKAAGARDFAVCFPRKRNEEVRASKDPAIVAKVNGVLVEVFSWDDGKLYE